ncbi:translation initiation factor eIF-1A [Candidatus Micrarchaeota archaeon]|nr:translation initiation factor eIF-1A [Candidatus Micrarchaeota archaeon]
MAKKEEPVIRVRKPREGELFGIVINMLGGGRALIMCEDDRERIGRIPGSMKRFIWVRAGDIVLVKPWEIEGERRCDIVWRYTKIQADWLRKRGYLKKLES